MHAYGAGAAELRLERVRVPPLRAPDHVLVRVHAASLNPLDCAMIGDNLLSCMVMATINRVCFAFHAGHSTCQK